MTSRGALTGDRGIRGGRAGLRLAALTRSYLFVRDVSDFCREAAIPFTNHLIQG